ncbi:transposable element Tcb2 transposase [Trichonephila clavipes]|uniref:Transposable element Tcb2 transposase n=1 Tax=Trichonephila clavipes TaxID=2585209 RepID=A0A8X6WCL0_TRICX|nr:transposable element Tcb2 transposase [Trichonephila clavipes]
MSTVSQRSHLTDSEAWRVVGRSEGSQTQAEIAQAIGVSQMLTARRHRNMNATLLQHHLRSATSTTVSTQTVRNQFHGVGLYARRSMGCVRPTSRHRRDRREWATEHAYFHLEGPDSRNNSAFVHESVRFSGGVVSVYGDISIDGRTDLYIIRDGPLTARRYRDEILRPIVVPYAAAIGDDFILMDDNCRPHRANLEDELLAANHPHNLSKNWKELFWKEWDRIPQHVINSLIDSMPQRCSMLLAVRGNYAPYGK